MIREKQKELVAGFVRRVETTIREAQMLVPGDRVLIGLSGGGDSVALCRVLQLLAVDWSLTLAFAHVNYHTRGADSKADERFCRRLARKLGGRIFVHSGSLVSGAKRGGNFQAQARRIRDEFFISLAHREDFDRIALGHHYDDQVETIAMGLHGGRAGFARGGIPRVRGAGQIIRPLFDCRRRDILNFLTQLGQQYREDISNQDQRYLRNRVRHQLLPLLRAGGNSAIDETLFRWGEFSARRSAILAEKTAFWLKTAIVNRGADWLALSTDEVRRCDRQWDYDILQHVARELGLVDPQNGAFMVERFGRLALVGRGGEKLSWGGAGAGAIIELSRAGVIFYAQPPRSPEPVEIPTAGVKKIAEWGVRISCRRRDRRPDDSVVLPRGKQLIRCDEEHVEFPLILRGPQPGDFLRPWGMVGRKKVADILSAAGVPSLLRRRTPVVVDQQGVLGVPGYHQDRRTRVTEDTRRVLLIELENLNQGTIDGGKIAR